MKKLILFLFSLTAILACDNDTYEPEYDNYWISLGIYETTSQNSSGFQISLDNGDTIIPLKLADGLSDFEDDARVQVYFSILEETSDTAILNSAILDMQEIILKDVLTLSDENTDSIGNDPVQLTEENIWISKNFINIYCQYNGGTTNHYFNLVKYENDSTDEDGRLILEYRHNSNGEEKTLEYEALISFDLNSITPSETSSLPLLIKVVDYNGDTLLWEDTYYPDLEVLSSPIINFLKPNFAIE